MRRLSQVHRGRERRGGRAQARALRGVSSSLLHVLRLQGAARWDWTDIFIVVIINFLLLQWTWPTACTRTRCSVSDITRRRWSLGAGPVTSSSSPGHTPGPWAGTGTPGTSGERGTSWPGHHMLCHPCSCWHCDTKLTGQRYVLTDQRPTCLPCYESHFAATCQTCGKLIGGTVIVVLGLKLSPLNFRPREPGPELPWPSLARGLLPVRQVRGEPPAAAIRGHTPSHPLRGLLWAGQVSPVVRLTMIMTVMMVRTWAHGAMVVAAGSSPGPRR